MSEKFIIDPKQNLWGCYCNLMAVFLDWFSIEKKISFDWLFPVFCVSCFKKIDLNIYLAYKSSNVHINVDKTIKFDILWLVALLSSSTNQFPQGHVLFSINDDQIARLHIWQRTLFSISAPFLLSFWHPISGDQKQQYPSIGPINWELVSDMKVLWLSYSLSFTKPIPAGRQVCRNGGNLDEFTWGSNFRASISNSQLHPVVVTSQSRFIFEQFAHCIFS